MFDKLEFLEAARFLQAADKREGFQRSAVSRAYYSAFLLARHVCRERGWIGSTGSGSDHGTVAAALNEIDERLGRDFRDLQQLRRNADYSERDFGSNAIADSAQLAIDLAEFIRDEMSRLS
jgi:uncharacterized protein (UPF0332 family)